MFFDLKQMEINTPFPDGNVLLDTKKVIYVLTDK